LCASQIGIGMRSSVSSHAYPNIIPWSPAPTSSYVSPVPVFCSIALSTPIAMSGDCSSSDTITPQVAPSMPNAASVYPIARIDSRARREMST
jgi:hypothetical protein